MQINLPDAVDIQTQALAAGFAYIDEYVLSLVERDKERVAIQEGVAAMREGRKRTFDEFAAEFRRDYGIRDVA